MPSPLSERIVKFLRYGDEGAASDLEGFDRHDWQQVLPWLDASGLALYFLHQVERLQGESLLPSTILARLRRNREDNCERTSAFLEQTRLIHQHFAARGIEFAVLKGYSLVPDYCPAPWLRHQCDLDYLVPENDVQRASSALQSLRYSRVCGAPASYTFAQTTGRVPSRDNMYKAGVNFSVELHTTLWDNNEVARLEPLPQVLARCGPHQISGLAFPALAREDQFIHECMHVLSHVLQFWIRLAWLYEIAGFIHRARKDAAFWHAVQNRIDGRMYVAKAVQFVSLLAADVFHAEAPGIRRNDCRALRLWVNEYGYRWAMHNLPGSKLSLFLFREFVEESRWRRLCRQRLFPLHRPHSAVQLNAAQPRRGPRVRLAEYYYAGQRLAFHVRETWSYWRENANWRRRLQQLKEAPPCDQLETVMQ